MGLSAHKAYNFAWCCTLSKNSLRPLMINKNIWFKGKNIAKILGYSDTDQALRYNVDSKDRKSFPVNCTGYSQRGRPK